MSVIGTMPDARKSARVRSDGTWTMIGSPGLKPSLRFSSETAIRTPLLLAGIHARRSATRTPVAEVRSCLVSATSLGNGSRHPRLGTPSHFFADAAAGAASIGTTASATRTPWRRTAPPYPRVVGLRAMALDPETERVRTRVRLMVEISARAGAFRKGLALAARRLTPAE